MRLRGALLGGGNIALRGHVPQWMHDSLASSAEIVAVADLSPVNLAAIRTALPAARLYEKAEDLLAREDLDFVDVCTPPFTHRALVEAACARRLHVVCEKPIAACLTDAEGIAAAVKAAGVVFVPCHQYHYSPQWQAVVRLLPQIGRVHLVEYEVHRTEANPGNPNWSPTWRTNRELAGGGILFDHGAHIFYQLRSVLGEPAAIQATVRTLRHATYGVEDSAFVVLDFGDRLAEVRLTWAARRRSIRFLFVGADGELVGDDERVVVRAASTEEISFADGMSRDSSHSDWYAPLFRSFLDRARRGDTSREPLDEALYVMRLISRAYESSEQRRAVPLADEVEAPLSPTLSAVTEVVSRVVEHEAGPAERSEGAPKAPPPVETALRTPRLVRAAGVLVLAGAAWWAAHDIDWQTLAASTAQASLLWIALAAAVNILAVYAMAARWRALLTPLAPLLSQRLAFKSLLMGFAVSTIVPARAGELARAEWLSRGSGLPRATVLGSIVLDQLVNAVGLFVGIALLPLVTTLPGWLHSGIWLAAGVVAVCGIAVFLVQPRAGRPTLAASHTRDPSGTGTGFLARARLGLAAMGDRKALARSLGVSMLAWMIEIVVVVLVLTAFDIRAQLGTSLLVLIAANLALLVPFAPPGNLGTLEVGAMLGLMEFGVPKETALACALAYHLLQVIPIGIAGLSVAGRSLARQPSRGRERTESPSPL